MESNRGFNSENIPPIVTGKKAKWMWAAGVAIAPGKVYPGGRVSEREVPPKGGARPGDPGQLISL